MKLKTIKPIKKRKNLLTNLKIKKIYPTRKSQIEQKQMNCFCLQEALYPQVNLKFHPEGL